MGVCRREKEVVLERKEAAVKIATTTETETTGCKAGDFYISIPDYLGCLSDRARSQNGTHHLHPYWSATTSEAALVEACDRPDWSVTRVSSIDPYHHVTHRRKQSTFSFLSRKTGFTQTGESPWELLRGMELEIDPYVTNFQLGGLRIYWTTPHGLRHYTPDTVLTTTTGQVFAEEVKASASYYHEPEYRSLMNRAEQGLSAVGIGFNMLDADQMRENRRRCYNVAKAFDDRFAAFGPSHLDVVRNALAKSKEGAAIGELTEAMGLHSGSAMQVINAMMCKRIVSYDLNLPFGWGTMVRQPPEAAKAMPDIRAILH